jgi:predicted enzyme related to lactoylglutathione lyase
MADDWARPLVHWEIQAHDPEKARNFYAQMFNWDITPAGPIFNIPAGIGAPETGPAGHIRQSSSRGFVPYFQVLNLQASLRKAVELGGTVTREAFDIPNGPTIAGIADPEGNAIVLVQQ